MDTATWLTLAQTFDRWSKARLVDYLIERGTIYPTRSAMLRFPKDELVRMAVDAAERCSS